MHDRTFLSLSTTFISTISQDRAGLYTRNQPSNEGDSLTGGDHPFLDPGKRDGIRRTLKFPASWGVTSSSRDHLRWPERGGEGTRTTPRCTNRANRAGCAFTY